MIQNSERLIEIFAKIYSSVAKINSQNHHDFEQVNCFDSPVKNGLCSSKVKSAGGLVLLKLCALPTDRQFVRIGYYEIRAEVAFYSLPQSFEQTKKTMNSILCSFKSLLHCDAYEKLRRKW